MKRLPSQFRAGSAEIHLLHSAPEYPYDGYNAELHSLRLSVPGLLHHDHKDLAILSSDEISSEIARVDEQLVTLTGEGASVVRPPYGSVNDTVKSTVGTPMILWSIDTLDWKTQDVE